MKKNWMVLGCFFFCCQVSAQPAPARVVIVGVVHSRYFLMRTDSMLRILRTLKPDVILNELDTLMGFFKKGYELVEPPELYREIRKRGLSHELPSEIEGTYQYRRNNPQVVVRPFDMAIPDRFKYGERLNDIESNLDNTLYNLPHDSLSEYQYRIQQWYVYLRKKIKNIFVLGYYDLNQPEITNNIREMMQIEAAQLPAILDSLPSLINLRIRCREKQAAWDLRNKIMADNIVHFVSQYPGKTIVVLTGVQHKYYLQDLLRDQQQPYNFILQEYYDVIR